MGLPPQVARLAGSWPNTPAPQRRPARGTHTRQSRSTREPAPARLTQLVTRPARPA